MKTYHKAECLSCKEVKWIAAKQLCRACYTRLKRTGSTEKVSRLSSCLVAGCERVVISHGYCELHWYRVKTYGDPSRTSRPDDWGAREQHALYQSWQWLARRSKNDVCERWKKDFWTFVHDVGDRPTADHRISRLSESEPYGPHNFEWKEPVFKRERGEDEKEYARRYMRDYRAVYPERAKTAELKKYYGITLDDYNAMLEKQNGVCAICGKEERAFERKYNRIRRLAVDHCHDTSKVRGLLCTHCNQGIGNFNHDRRLLLAAIDYLERTK